MAGGSQRDGMFTSALANALADEPLPRSMWALYLLAAALVAAIAWASIAEEDQAGQELARLDPTRVEAQENEGVLRRTAMRVAIARLRAEAYGGKFELP